MWYLSGAIRAELYSEKHLGFMLTPNMGNRVSLSQTVWAADTGCFSQGASFSLDRYLKWLDARESYRITNLFSTAPDVLGDAKATLERSAPVLELLRERGWRPALVGQDGLEDCEVPWDSFDVLFLGGSTDWKLSSEAAGLTAEARRRGKWVHMGRVNSKKRLHYASQIGCGSADGTFLAFGSDILLPKLRVWLDELNISERTKVS